MPRLSVISLNLDKSYANYRTKNSLHRISAHTQPSSRKPFAKGLIAVMAALIVHAFIKRAEKFKLAGYAVGGAVSEIWMIAGYYLYAAVFLGKGFAGAWLSVGGNARPAARESV